MKNEDILRSILENANNIIIEDCENTDFKKWKIEARTGLTQVFGADSIEVKSFKKLKFCYLPLLNTNKVDALNKDLFFFRRDLNDIKKKLLFYIDNLKNKTAMQDFNKIFISHSSKDEKIVEDLIGMLEAIGLTNKQIFCSSLKGYGVPLGENFLDRIKKELDGSSLVLFVLSKNFFRSPVCLCEMGATWVKTSEHIPILIPPFTFNKIKGVIPLTQGFIINDKLSLNLFKNKIEEAFSIDPINSSVWERKRDKILVDLSLKIG